MSTIYLLFWHIWQQKQIPLYIVWSVISKNLLSLRPQANFIPSPLGYNDSSKNEFLTENDKTWVSVKLADVHRGFHRFTTLNKYLVQNLPPTHTCWFLIVCGLLYEVFIPTRHVPVIKQISFINKYRFSHQVIILVYAHNMVFHLSRGELFYLTDTNRFL